MVTLGMISHMKISYFVLLIIFYLGFTQSTSNAQTPIEQGPVSSWVENIDYIPGKNDDQSPYRYLLIDQQKNAILQENYYHTVVHLYNSQGVQEMSSITMHYDPSFQSLIIHKILIHRGDETQKRVTNDFKVLQRETNLNRSMYDGSLTAIKELNDIRPGDIIEYNYTIKGYNPIYGNHRFATLYQDYELPINHIYQTFIFNKKMNVKYSTDAVTADVLIEQDKWIYKWDLRDRKAEYFDYTIPVWYEQHRFVTLSSMKNWKDVVTWATELYDISSVDRKKLSKEIESHLSLHNSDENILAAIRFVQDEIRYLGFEEGINAFKPHNPLQVLKQRFGDCKDKSFLLATILQEIGIDAVPILVHSSKGESIENRAPSPHCFNHCIVTFTKDEETFFIDPTISYQGGNLDHIVDPTYEKGLPIKEGVGNLQSFGDNITPQIIVDEILTLDSINGSATYNIISRFTGEKSDSERAYFNRNSRSEIKKNYSEFYQNTYQELTADSLELIDTSRNNSNELIVKESYQIPIIWEETDKHFVLNLSSLILNDYVNLSVPQKTNTPYDLGDLIEYIQTTIIHLPGTWTISNKENKINNKYFDYRHSMTFEESDTSVKI